MCGLVGFLSGPRGAHDPAILHAMTAILAHRGPDSDGFWMDGATGIALGHRRLSIVDLSEAGHQPMLSVSGRFVMVFNGEIYNHLDMRAQLGQAGHAPPWRGHSDTETMLAGFEAWGIEATIQRCVGMFAFAVWDTHRQMLTLGRDRVGEKPLYYGWQGDSFVFGSELKALKPHPEFLADIDLQAAGLFFKYGYVPSPFSIYKGISKLDPGVLLTVSVANKLPQLTPYWSALDTVRDGIQSPFLGDERDAIDQLERILMQAVKGQMMADVPLGAFLSGGVDSSAVVALMQAQSPVPIKTFSIGFQNEAYNEAAYAKQVAAHLKTDHMELVVTPKAAMDVIPLLPQLYDEPFADSSQIPTFLVAQLARQHVTVALSGDGGDELFCGYNRYRVTDRLWTTLSRVPVGIRRQMATLAMGVSPSRWDQVVGLLGRWTPELLQGTPGNKIHKGAKVITSDSAENLYRRLISIWDDPESLVLGAPPHSGRSKASTLSVGSAIEHMMAEDLITYLPDDILVKVDRAGMGVSLETRVPFLDHRVIEFAWQLPMSMKLKAGQTKWALRQALYRHVPQALIDRPKMGFGIPLDDWLRGPLREWADALLDEFRLDREGILNSALIRKKWKEHCSGERNWQPELWAVLMFQTWYQNQ